MAADTPFHSGGTVTGRAVFPYPPGAGPQVPKPRDHLATITGRQQGKTLRLLDMVNESVVTREQAKRLARHFDGQLMMQSNAIGRLNYADLEALVLASIQDKGSVFNAMYGSNKELLMNPLPKRGLNGPLDIPLTWKAALREVQKIFPTAVLAGGALRDRDHGVKVKDLDIFVEAADDRIDSVHKAQRLLKEAGIETDLIDTTIYASWFGDKTIVGILETKFENAPPVSLIFTTLKTDETILGAFDFGLSQIMWDGQQLKKTGAYDSDYRMKRFRLVTECGHKQLVRRMERWARLKEKYPNHKLDFGVMSPDGNIGSLSDAVIRVAHGV